MTLSQEQHAERANALGASDAAAALGLSPWMTMLQLYQEKVGEVTREVEPTERMYWGNVHEEAIARRYAEIKGVKVQRWAKATVHKEFPFLISHLDRVVQGEDVAVECKSVDRFCADDYGPDGSDRVPEHVIIQVQHQMATTPRLKRIDVAALIGGNEHRIYPIERDSDLIATLVDLEVEFWINHVEARVEPDLMNSADIMRRWPREAGAVITADETIFATCLMLQAQKIKVKNAGLAQKDVENIIKSFMAENAILVDDLGKELITWKNKVSNRFDIKAFREAHPKLCAEFTKESATRTFLLKKIEEVDHE